MSNTIEQYRDLFSHITDGHTYLNHCAVGPLANSTADAIRIHIDERNRHPIENFESWMDTIRECRERVRQYINAPSPDHITFTGNTSDGLTIAAESLQWNDGDEIILNDLEFPANIQPFRALERYGVSLTYIHSDNGTIRPEQIEEAITDKTRLVSISAVQYLSGFKADLQSIGAICSEHGIWFVVDGIQSLGAFPTDVRSAGIDVLATGGHKWLLAEMGIGFLYLSEKFLAEMTPAKSGWLSVENPMDLHLYEQPWQQSARRFDTGTPNMTGIISLNASLQLMTQVGLEAIEQRIMSLSAELYERARTFKNTEIYTPENAADRAGIVTFHCKDIKDPEKVVQQLKKEKITISTRDGYFRTAPHFYNTADELDLLFRRLREYQ